MKNMKRYISYIFIVSVTLCLFSCLDENPKDQLDQEAIYNNADNIYKTPWLHYTTISAATRSLKGFKAPAAAYMITTRLQPTRR